MTNKKNTKMNISETLEEDKGLVYLSKILASNLYYDIKEIDLPSIKNNQTILLGKVKDYVPNLDNYLSTLNILIRGTNENYNGAFEIYDNAIILRTNFLLSMPKDNYSMFMQLVPETIVHELRHALDYYKLHSKDGVDAKKEDLKVLTKEVINFIEDTKNKSQFHNRRRIKVVNKQRNLYKSIKFSMYMYTDRKLYPSGIINRDIDISGIELTDDVISLKIVVSENYQPNEDEIYFRLLELYRGAMNIYKYDDSEYNNPLNISNLDKEKIRPDTDDENYLSYLTTPAEVNARATTVLLRLEDFITKNSYNLHRYSREQLEEFLDKLIIEKLKENDIHEYIMRKQKPKKFRRLCSRLKKFAYSILYDSEENE